MNSTIDTNANTSTNNRLLVLLLRDLLLSSSEINIFDSFEKFVRDSNGTDNSYPVSKKILGIVWASVSISAGFLLVLGNA